jgi:predicted CXXCH cytochrome family protein
VRGSLLLVLLLAACAGTSASRGHLADETPSRTGRHPVTSNVTAADYAGSASCTPCHSDIATAFGTSPMHRMTRLVDSTDVRAPFAGETLHFKDDTATLEQKGPGRFVRLTNSGSPPRFYRVTRVIGGRYREDFAGVPVASEDAPAPSAFDRGDEVVLPVSYLIGPARLRYKGYSVLVHERSALEPGPVWNRTCLLCHNTAPYLASLFGALEGPKAPHYQGEVVDALLEGAHAFRYTVTDGAALSRAVGAEVLRSSGATVDTSGVTGKMLRRAIDATRDHLTGSGLLEVGIGCESCHGGSAEHVRDPARVVPSFEPVAPFLSVRKVHGDAAPTRAELVNHACARCHQVLFSRYPFTWEGGKRYAMPGGSPINSGEGRDFLLGACSGAMACTACHDHHARDERAHLDELATPLGNRICIGCHAELGGESALRAHAHHDPKGAGGACIACHMPKKNMSLDTALTRYHRIGSPDDPLRVLNDRPIECAACHADKSVGDLVTSMQQWWHKTYDADALRALYGDVTSNVLAATLERGKPHEKAAALAMLGEKPPRDLAPLIARELADEYPLVREFAAVALVRAVGPCPLSLYAGSDRLQADAEACLKGAGLPVPTWYPQSHSTPSTAEPAED